MNWRKPKTRRGKLPKNSLEKWTNLPATDKPYPVKDTAILQIPATKIQTYRTGSNLCPIRIMAILKPVCLTG